MPDVQVTFSPPYRDANRHDDECVDDYVFRVCAMREHLHGPPVETVALDVQSFDTFAKRIAARVESGSFVIHTGGGVVKVEQGDPAP